MSTGPGGSCTTSVVCALDLLILLPLLFFQLFVFFSSIAKEAFRAVMGVLVLRPATDRHFKADWLVVTCHLIRSHLHWNTDKNVRKKNCGDTRCSNTKFELYQINLYIGYKNMEYTIF
ncbi:hypothetical protein B9Z55_018928 [Caenorhabditis nigoni]|uniref:Uncharacterized protein n=1 Tax=Caenorhabditis nigoni TaxID=1611254 RepID=A0A2G5TGY8_9PELO|nr:hypothetical protein B9Z55_018928 [Caenorhabditis nigoni]